jgi:hypothetical protein
LRSRIARLEGTPLATVTLEAVLDRLTRGDALDDPDFCRRLAASPIGHILDNLIARLPDEEHEQ